MPMTQDKWNRMSPAEKDVARDMSGLSPQLIGLEGWRVEVSTRCGEKRRFYVGRSTGWKPCHLEIHNRRSLDGTPAAKHYAKITQLYRR